MCVGSVAYREIASGEEITYDYCINSYGNSEWQCGCGHPKCRRVHSTDFFKLPRDKLVEYVPLLDTWFAEHERVRPKLEALRRELAK